MPVRASTALATMAVAAAIMPPTTRVQDAAAVIDNYADMAQAKP